MSSVHKSRELAIQVLFLWDAQGLADADLGQRCVNGGSDDVATQQRAMQIAQSAWDVKEASDQTIEKLAPQWPTRRQPGVDRAILRLAVWEFQAGQTPPKVIIDEAIELAKEYSTENSPAFVNGVLDAVLRQKQTPQ